MGRNCDMTSAQLKIFVRMIGVHPDYGYGRILDAKTIGILLSDLDIVANLNVVVNITASWDTSKPWGQSWPDWFSP